MPDHAPIQTGPRAASPNFTLVRSLGTWAEMASSGSVTEVLLVLKSSQVVPHDGGRRGGSPDDLATSLAEPAHQFRMFTAREITRATVNKEAKDWIIISSFAHGVKGMVSVGLKAVALVNEV